MIFLLKDLTFLIKFGIVGIWALVLYIIYLGYLGAENIVKGNVKFDTIRLFSSNIGTTMGVFSLAFFV